MVVAIPIPPPKANLTPLIEADKPLSNNVLRLAVLPINKIDAFIAKVATRALIALTVTATKDATNLPIKIEDTRIAALPSNAILFSLSVNHCLTS